MFLCWFCEDVCFCFFHVWFLSVDCAFTEFYVGHVFVFLQMIDVCVLEIWKAFLMQ